MNRLALLSLVLAGCIDVPDTPGAMCQQTSDCPGNGEVCQDGVCWGDPPAGTFAAVLTPPTTRSDLVAVEIPSLTIPQNGYLADLTLASPVSFSGRVEAACAQTADICDHAALEALVTVSRPSRIQGGLPLAQSVRAVASGTGDTFAFGLPQTGPGDVAYQVTVVPVDDPDDPRAPSTRVPPARLSLSLTAATDQTIPLGGDKLRHLTGHVGGLTGPLTDYRVRAIGRFGANETPGLVSTIAKTDETGAFELVLSDGIVGPVEIVAVPIDYGNSAAPRPTLHLPGVASDVTDAELAEPDTIAGTIDVEVTVTTQNGDGSIAAVSGARVLASGSVTPVVGGGPMNPTPTRASLDIETTTDSSGVAHITVLDGFGDYGLAIVPQASSSAGALFGGTLDAGSGTQAVKLPTRIAIHGVVEAADGSPVGGMTITAKPSFRYAISLDAAPASFLAQIPAPTTVSAESGDFAIFVDPAVAGISGLYDLDFEPATGSNVPHWTVSEVSVQHDQTNVSLGNVEIPDPSFLHGRITDPSGQGVVAGELHIYAVSEDESPCSDATHPPPDCAVPVVQQAHSAAEDDGLVKFTLPRPSP